MKKVLLSARDPGAALNILSLYKILERSDGFEPELAASRPAFDIIRGYGVDPEPFIFEDRVNDSFSEKEDLSPLLSKADELLGKTDPDIVLTGLSSFGAGIDEALILKSRVKTILYQDYWGDLNPVLGKYPDLVFCLDNLAAQVTKKRFGNGIECRIVGFPKLDLLKESYPDVPGKEAKNLFNPEENKKIISWFGQSPEIPGHNQVLDELIGYIKNYKNDIIFLLRGHPKFKDDIGNYFRSASEQGIQVIDVTGEKDPIPILKASDLIVTPFSSCGLDHCYLSFLSSRPMGSVLYLTNNKVLCFYKKISSLDFIPLIKFGLGYFINTDDKKIGEAYPMESIYEASEKYWTKCKEILNFFDYQILLNILKNN